ncbi:YceD family protein [Hasllibacter sp. MH4015]|uniref:YceD family protein n=1 Tax=Hasllibacter sp. MH4015 TaxID=2854029 RepID=UPI001CD410F9|nr:YceD family protein [Hasllibacter sp. MH4015]
MSDHNLPLARLNRATETPFKVEPDADARASMARDLGVPALRKVRLDGRAIPEGKADWRLEAKLGATAVQNCVVTLEPVTTRIDVPLVRQYRAHMPEPSGEEMEMPEDDTLEPLRAEVDLMALLTEALALALPDYPRAEGVELGEAIFAAPGVTPMRDEDAKPLAGLAALRDRLSGNGNGDENEG